MAQDSISSRQRNLKDTRNPRLGQQLPVKAEGSRRWYNTSHHCGCV